MSKLTDAGFTETDIEEMRKVKYFGSYSCDPETGDL